MVTGKGLHRFKPSKPIVWGFLSILLLTKAALAGYVPPAEQEAPSDYSRSGTAGHRGGCQDSEATPLTLLAPQTHTGQTASTHPTFAWFVPTSNNMEFRLFEYDLNNQPTKLIATISLPPSSAGIRKITLPEKYALRVGKKYLWQLTIHCPDSQPPLIARADIKVVSSPLTKPTSSASKPVETYAQASLWYDALAQALSVAPPGKLGGEAALLLEELAKVEARINSTDEISSHIEGLKRIALAER